ncbi:MAG: hypothetical protein HYX32_04180 [Actinobacteria bacterium]|nr:hypothetical protein [Actinomycetota bacterium]
MASTAAVGMSVHTGWAVSVAIAGGASAPAVVLRRRVELLDPALPRAPYHAAQDVDDPAEQARIVEEVVADARVRAGEQVLALQDELGGAGYDLASLAVLGQPRSIPDAVAKVLASHALMHAAEGALYRDALVEAAVDAGIPVELVPPKQLDDLVHDHLGWDAAAAAGAVAALGKTVGSPWQKDHKHAALAALVALELA